MLPGGMVIPSAIPEFPDTLEGLLIDRLNNIVIAQFVKMRPRFERASVKGSTVDWEQEYKTVINVKKTVRGAVASGLIEGDFSSSGSYRLDAGTGPMPTPPDMNKDYLIFLSYVEPSENVQEGLIHGNDLAKGYIFYISAGRPAETSCNINKILPADGLAQTKAPEDAPTLRLPLPGGSLSLDAAQAQAETIVVGHVVALTAFFNNSPVVNQAVDIEILKTLRGKAHGAIQYQVPVNIGKEAAPELGKDYLFFLSHYSAVLKVAPASAL